MATGWVHCGGFPWNKWIMIIMIPPLSSGNSQATSGRWAARNNSLLQLCPYSIPKKVMYDYFSHRMCHSLLVSVWIASASAIPSSSSFLRIFHPLSLCISSIIIITPSLSIAHNFPMNGHDRLSSATIATAHSKPTTDTLTVLREHVNVCARTRNCRSSLADVHS